MNSVLVIILITLGLTIGFVAVLATLAGVCYGITTLIDIILNDKEENNERAGRIKGK